MHRINHLHIPTAELNRFLHSIDMERATSPASKKPKIYYMTQAAAAPPRFVLFTDKGTRPETERIAGWSTFFDLPEIDALTRGRADGDVLASYREALGKCAGRSLLSRLLYLNARTYLLDDLLPKMDRMSMAHALETRSPFLDRALAEYVATLPDALKRRGRHGKVVLKKAL